MQVIDSVLILVLPFLVGATPLSKRTSDPACNTGSINCCNQVTKPDAGTTSLLGTLGIVGTVTGLIGLECNPISVIGISGNSCQQQVACCTGNTYNGLITLGCSPFNTNL